MNNQEKMLTIWSIRTSVSRGNYWQAECKRKESEIQQWLKIFRDDEPNVTFVASLRKPAIKK